MFKQGDIVICVDDVPSHSLQGCLTRYAQYVVEDYSDGFVTLEGVKGEWHESRFVLVEGE